jgi:hypothetical protein
MRRFGSCFLFIGGEYPREARGECQGPKEVIRKEKEIKVRTKLDENAWRSDDRFTNVNEGISRWQIAC